MTHQIYQYFAIYKKRLSCGNIPYWSYFIFILLLGLPVLTLAQNTYYENINCQQYPGLEVFKNLQIEIPWPGQKNSWVPVIISFENIEPSQITGKLQWLFAGQTIQHTFSLESAGISKKKIYNYVYIQGEGKLAISLLQNKEEIYYQELSSDIVLSKTAQVLVMTSHQSLANKTHADWASGIEIPHSWIPGLPIQVIYGNASNITPHWVGLSALTAIVFDDLTTEWPNLSSAQIQALHTYVQNGGVLYLCAGVREAHIRDPKMQDFLPCDLKNLVSLTFDSRQNCWNETPLASDNTQINISQPLPTPLQLRICKPHPNTQELLSIQSNLGKYPVVLGKNYGDGKIIFVACSFSDDLYWKDINYRQYHLNQHPCEKRHLLAQFCISLLQPFVQKKDYIMSSIVNNEKFSLALISGVQVPPAGTILIWLFVYGVIIVAILGIGYFLKRHQATIFLTSICSIIFAIFIAYVEQQNIYTAELTRNSFSLVQSSYGNNTAKIFHYLTLTTNHTREISISFDNPNFFLLPKLGQMIQTTSPLFFTSWEINATQPQSWEKIQCYRQTPSVFYAQGMLNTPNLDCQLAIKNQQLVGTITNHSNAEWQELYFYANKQIANIGNIRVGETKDISAPLKSFNNTIMNSPNPVINPFLQQIPLLAMSDAVLIGWCKNDFIHLKSNVKISTGHHTTILCLTLPKNQFDSSQPSSSTSSNKITFVPMTIKCFAQELNKGLNESEREWRIQIPPPDLTNDIAIRPEQSTILQIHLDKTKQITPNLISTATLIFDIYPNPHVNNDIIDIYIYDTIAEKWSQVPYKNKNKLGLYFKSEEWSYKLMIHSEVAQPYICQYSKTIWIKILWHNEDDLHIKFIRNIDLNIQYQSNN